MSIEPKNRQAAQALTFSNLMAHGAEQLCAAAVPLIAVTQLGAGAREVGLLAAAQSLPFLLFALPFGVWADRSSRLKIMISAESFRAFTLIVLLCVGLIWGHSLWSLGLLGFFGACGTVAFVVALPALVPQIVAKEDLPQVNMRLELARSLAISAGPALAGVLVASVSDSTAFIVAAILSGAALMTLWRIRGLVNTATNQGDSRAQRSIATELREGFNAVLQERYLRPVFYTSIVWNLSWFVLHAAYTPYAVRRLGLSEAQVGMTLGIFGVGMILGSFAFGRVVNRFAFGKVVVIGPAFSLLGMLLIQATEFSVSSSSASFMLLLLGFFCFGFGPVMWTISTTTLRQNVTPNHLMARVGAVFLTCNAGARPIGALIGAGLSAWVGAQYGSTGQWLGERACLWVASLGFLAQFILVITAPIARLKIIPQKATAVTLDPSSQRA